MDDFMQEIRDYAEAVGKKPGTVVQQAGAGGGQTWRRWEGGGECMPSKMSRIRAYMAANPPKTSDDAASDTDEAAA